ncbi:MAG: hypothetical protein ACOYK8_09770 [Alphaproteobacteria bacterium]
MSLDAKFRSLKARRESYKQAIAAENKRPCPNSILIQHLRKQNLKVKDQMRMMDLLSRT